MMSSRWPEDPELARPRFHWPYTSGCLTLLLGLIMTIKGGVIAAIVNKIVGPVDLSDGG